VDGELLTPFHLANEIPADDFDEVVFTEEVCVLGERLNFNQVFVI
jgi:hypothetical protein